MTDTNTTLAGDVFLDLQAQWDAAEQARECEAGDATIRRDGPRSFGILEATWAWKLGPDERIRARPPRPWQDLADVLANEVDVDVGIDLLAEALHEQGVRMDHDAAAAALREAADDVRSIDGRNDDALEAWPRARADQIEQAAGR